jgi:hypothetical protein
MTTSNSISVKPVCFLGVGLRMGNSRESDERGTGKQFAEGLFRPAVIPSPRLARERGPDAVRA